MQGSCGVFQNEVPVATRSSKVPLQSPEPLESSDSVDVLLRCRNKFKVTSVRLRFADGGFPRRGSHIGTETDVHHHLERRIPP